LIKIYCLLIMNGHLWRIWAFEIYGIIYYVKMLIDDVIREEYVFIKTILFKKSFYRSKVEMITGRKGFYLSKRMKV
jgi:hypothetical protein